MLLGGSEIREIPIMTPKGILLNLELLDIQREDNAVSCAVRKDAGDDPDTTDGLLIYARAEKTDAGEWKKQREPVTEEKKEVEKRSSCLNEDMEFLKIVPQIDLEGGVGVGRVTKPGLSQKIGEAAINPVPRAMILKAAEEAADKYHYDGG